MIEKTEFGYTGSITDLPLEVRGDPELAAAFAMAITVGAEQKAEPLEPGEVKLSESKPCELMPTCEVCNKNTSVGVASVPGVPYSAAYCRECLAANAHPYFIVVANTACCGGLENTCPEWQDMVRDTLAHLGKSAEQFEADVVAALKKEQDALSEPVFTKNSEETAKLEVLVQAAMHLCVLITGHSIECDCETCAAACAAVPLLPEMSPMYQEQFARRIAVQAVVKAQKANE
jgi:hypothetical protein